MISIKNKIQCCGCGACVQKCPKQCISLKEDNEGFLYPHVDATACIDCGLCKKVCPVQNSDEPRRPLKALSAINDDLIIRKQSSSGGVFSLIAERIINEGGVVFGARYDNDWQVCLDYTDSLGELSYFRGSKYVQARTDEAYKQCEKFLKDGRIVLFTGTPCQISGLRNFLRRDFENLILLDVVCHGVPSPKVWRRYIQEEFGIDTIKSVSMRDKTNGWKAFNFKIEYQDKGTVQTLNTFHKKNIYMNAFLCDMILRPSCHNCYFKNFRSGSDLTIADFWGISNLTPNIDDDLGTSLVFINTSKGDHFFMPFMNGNNRINETDIDAAISYNPAIQKSSRAWHRRDKFFRQIDKAKCITKLMKRELRPTTVQSIKNIVKFILRIK